MYLFLSTEQYWDFGNRGTLKAERDSNDPLEGVDEETAFFF